MDFKVSIMAAKHDWVSEHLEAVDETQLHALYVADHPCFADTTDIWSWLAFAAGRTKRIRLGTHVTGAPFHHPFRLAKQIATVDVLSGGRATLGIGAGYDDKDFAPYGFEKFSFPDRIGQLEETLQVMKQFFTGQSEGFAGKFIKLEGNALFGPQTVQRPHPSFVIGLNRPGIVMDLAAREADAINTWQLSPEQVGELREPLADACRKVGREPDSLGLTSDVIMLKDATHTQAEDLAHLVRDRTRGLGRNKAATDWDAGGMLYGDSDSMREQLSQFREVGVSEVTVAISSLDEIHWLNEEVVRRLEFA